MTKERKLAIEMWTGIRNLLSDSDRLSSKGINYFKRIFCRDHDLHWDYDCWFCHYILVCRKCPLQSCGFDSDYRHVMNVDLGKTVRIDACNNIIKALGGVV